MQSAKLNALIEELRALDDSLSRVKLNKVEIFRSRRDIRITLISDKAVDEKVNAEALHIVNQIIPQSFSNVSLVIMKKVFDEELVKKALITSLKENFFPISHLFSEDDIIIEKNEGLCKFTLIAEPSAAEIINRADKLKVLSEYLERNFCEDFVGEVQLKEEKPIDEELIKPRPVEVEFSNYRIIKVSCVTPLDKDFKSDTAIYIDDIKGEMDKVTLCGKILSINEKTTVTGKPMFRYEITDYSGKITGLYFNKKTTENAVRKLAVGDAIIFEGSLETFHGKLSLTIRKIARCEFPENFVPELKSGKPVPKSYSLVTPEPIETTEQADFMVKEKKLPSCLMGKSFVVFDLETTGTEPTECRITEIGAVKIVDGKFTERFQTLINPMFRIPQLIVDLTGIDDELVKDAPVFEDVCGDFYRFTDGCVLVAHNIDFDYKFIKLKSQELEYYYTNKGIDTLQLARELVSGVHNYKLNTLAEFFGITFHHHRALSDAFATAEMFIKLIELKKCLPDGI